MKERKALKLALEALKNLPGFLADVETAIMVAEEALANHISDATKMVAESEQEPVAWMDIDEKGFGYGLRYWSEPDNRHEVPLYTTPPQRKSLTDEFILSLHYGCSTALKFARAIEAAHGIKG